MNNFIIISYFEKQDNQESLESAIKDEFPRHLEEQNEGLRYLAFAGKNQAAVEDFIKETLDQFNIGTEEYVALYYSREEDANKIQRAMLLGHDDLIEDKIKKVKPEDHIDTLSRLLDFDFVKEMRNP